MAERAFKAKRAGAGSKITISMSKIRKITANRKNRVEKGRRADRRGSKPHSKGDSFSRSIVERAVSIRVITNSKEGKKIAQKIVKKERCMVGCATGNGKLTIFCYRV